MADVIQGLWIGDRLSTMESLSIASFLANGHPYHLYVYDEALQVPTGVVLQDANDVIPASQIFQYRDRKSYAGFADQFRYQLLWQKGGWWSDTDVVCLRPFEFESEYVFSSELTPEGAVTPNNGIMRVPRGAPLLEYLLSVCRLKDPATLQWGETGPRLIQEALQQFDLGKFVTPPDTFCPIPWFAWMDLLIPGRSVDDSGDVFGVHLWNELWRRSDVPKDAPYAPGCLYELYKARFLGQCDPTLLGRLKQLEDENLQLKDLLRQSSHRL